MVTGGAAGGGAGIQIPGVQLPGGIGQIAGRLGIPGLPGMGGGAAKVEGAPASAASSPAAAGGNAPPSAFGYRNIKRFSFLGPLAFEVGVAKDEAAVEPDVVVEMRFVGGDWRVVGVKPRI